MAKLTSKQRLQFSGLLKGIRGRDTLINQAATLAVPAIHEGDNISLINRLINAEWRTAKGNPTKDLDNALRFFSKVTGHGIDKDRKILIGAKSAKARKRGAEAWAEHVESNMSIRDAVVSMSAGKVKQELTEEQKLEKLRKALKRDYKQAVEIGLSAEQVLDLINTVITETEAELATATAAAA